MNVFITGGLSARILQAPSRYSVPYSKEALPE
jgi:hypothetical protein